MSILIQSELMEGKISGKITLKNEAIEKIVNELKNRSKIAEEDDVNQQKPAELNLDKKTNEHNKSY